MALKDMLAELKEFDTADLTVDNIGSWPFAVKGLLLIFAFLACLAAGYFLMIAEKKERLTYVESQEQELKSKFEKLAFKTANLDAYRQQMVEMEESFEALLSQLPSDTEVPGLLEDITNRGVENGLQIDAITLQPEKTLEYYVELPISIEVQGNYHELAAFVSGIASLPRIVTLHDFNITKEKRKLKMKILAKTYRYKGEEDGA